MLIPPPVVKFNHKYTYLFQESVQESGKSILVLKEVPIYLIYLSIFKSNMTNPNI